ncbi:MAG: hypothetical protein JKY03_12480 [Aureispira sp.]|nr:hypothetical protein [Aureispira sp.]
MEPKNWTDKTRFEALLNELYNSKEEPKWRYLVFQYVSRYQEEYYFDCLENTFVFLEEEFKDNKVRELFQAELEELQEEVTDARGEYCLSLNEIAEVVNRLLNTEPLAKNDVQQMINHIWEAYSCNLKPVLFVNREDQVLSQLVKESIEFTFSLS